MCFHCKSGKPKRVNEKIRKEGSEGDWKKRCVRVLPGRWRSHLPVQVCTDQLDQLGKETLITLTLALLSAGGFTTPV